MLKLKFLALSLLLFSMLLAGCEGKYTERQLAPSKIARESVERESLIVPKIDFGGTVPPESDRWVEVTHTDAYTGVKLKETMEVGEDGTLYNSRTSVLQAGGPNYSEGQNKVKAVFHGKRGDVYDFRFPDGQSMTVNSVPVDK
ncbi:MAG: hypothetical protein WC792_04155 [Candidatus Micrarchaeia archaeon]|jgi:hypothetical protein